MDNCFQRLFVSYQASIYGFWMWLLSELHNLFICKATAVLYYFFDPFAPTRSLSQMLNFMDQIADRGIGAVTSHRGWDVKEDNEALKLRMDMPGIDKEKVKILVEQNILIIKGEEEESEGESEGRRYSSRIELPRNVYKVDEIKAEMKNGVLNVRVPKVKEE